MNWKRWAMACVGAAVFVWAYQWVFHGWYLKDWYMETANLWRTETEMQNYWYWLAAGQIWIAAVAAWIYTKGYENKGWWEGSRYGVWIGLLLAGTQIGVYAVMPVSIALAAAWVVGAFLEGVGMGTVIGWMYRSPKAAA